MHNERLCKLRVKGKYNITLINAYAPTEDKTEEIKEQFYDDLQYMVDKVPKSDQIIILGDDVNAKLGKESAYQKITGKHTLHEETNRNGELLCDFAAANNMTVMSTQFQHKQIHKGTWRSPDYNTINQTDHVLVNQNKKEAIEDV